MLDADDKNTTGRATSRRALFAAAAVFATMVASQKANAFARPPWHDDDRGHGGGGHRCFLRGTHILTPQGEVKVEDLAVGDLVSHSIKRQNQSNGWAVGHLPVRLSSGGLANFCPSRSRVPRSVL